MVIAGLDISKNHYACVARKWDPLCGGIFTHTMWMSRTPYQGMGLGPGLDKRFFCDITPKKQEETAPEAWDFFLGVHYGSMLFHFLNHVKGLTRATDCFIAIEDFAYNRDMMVIHSMARVLDTVMLKLLKGGWGMQKYSPTTVKCFAGGGRKDKDEMREAAEGKMYIPESFFKTKTNLGSDVVDAFWLMKLGMAEMTLRKYPDKQDRYSKKELQALETCLKKEYVIRRYGV